MSTISAGKIPNNTAVLGRKRGHWQHAREGYLLLIKKGAKSWKLIKCKSDFKITLGPAYLSY